MKIYGHQDVLSRIPQPFPPTMLITGPAGVGKRRVATMIAERLRTSEVDLQILESPTVGQARQIAVHHRVAPAGRYRVSLIDLTSVTPAAQHTLLKVLEDAGPMSRFVIHSDTHVLPTVVSRCFQMRLGPLSNADLAAVLEDNGYLATDAREAVVQAGGSASRALEIAASLMESSPARTHTMRLLTAIIEDSPGINKVLTEIVSASCAPYVVSLLAHSLQGSFTDMSHALALLPVAGRLQALDLLTTNGRPSLRIVAAAQTLLSAVRQVQHASVMVA